MGDLNLGSFMGSVPGISTALNLVGTVAGGIMNSAYARKQAEMALPKMQEAQRKLDQLENNRQAIINPYSGITSVADMAKDLTGMMSNPYASLGVATNAAKMQIEEADISLANTLDTLRSTGASAGGATALAMAALKSKQGVAASIEQQEVNNEKLKAQGEANLMSMKVAEQMRLQGIAISEEQRVQDAETLGKKFVFEYTEKRETDQLDRQQALVDKYESKYNKAKDAQHSAMMGMVSGLTGALTAGVSAYGDFQQMGVDKRNTYNTYLQTQNLLGTDKENIKSFEDYFR